MRNKARELVKGVANLTHCAVLGIAYCPEFTELPGLKTVTNSEVRGYRTGNTTVMVRRPKKPP